MPAVTEELALRYLLELSADIRAAILLGQSGEALASAPERAADETLVRCSALVREADALADGGGEPIELDVTLPGGGIFLVRDGKRSLVCVTGPFALPGLILHDMRVVMNDLRGGDGLEGAR